MRLRILCLCLYMVGYALFMSKDTWCFSNVDWLSNWKSRESHSLFPVKGGYMDNSGEIVIKLKDGMSYGRIPFFSNGLAVMQKNTKSGWKSGYIDKTGKFIIQPQFEDAEPFSDGLGLVRTKDWKPKYIDKAGKVVITPKYDQAYSFSEGLARVEVNGKKGYYIDKTGKIVITLPSKVTDYTDYRDFSSGLAAVSLIVPAKYQGREIKVAMWGFIDKTGKFAIEPQFINDVHDFSEGLASVQLGNQYGFIDKTGKFVVKPQFDDAGLFSGGLAPVRIGDKWGYIDTAGEMIVEPQFRYALPFSEGLATVGLFDNKEWGIGFIDPKGQVVSRTYARFAEPFKNGLARVHLSDWLTAYVDKSGNFIGPSSEMFTNSLKIFKNKNNKASEKIKEVKYEDLPEGLKSFVKDFMMDSFEANYESSLLDDISGYSLDLNDDGINEYFLTYPVLRNPGSGAFADPTDIFGRIEGEWKVITGPDFTSSEFTLLLGSYETDIRDGLLILNSKTDGYYDICLNPYTGEFLKFVNGRYIEKHAQ